MSVLEKLLLLDATLRVLDGALAGADGTRTPDALPTPLRDLVRGRFRAFAAAVPSASGGDVLTRAFLPQLSQDRPHLEAGGAVLRVLRGGHTPSVALAHLAPGPGGPRLVVGEIDPQFLFSPDGLRPAVEDDVAADVIDAMQQVTAAGGTGSRASAVGRPVAGKTGTAEQGNGKPPHAWFTAFAPADNPQIAVAVVVEDGGNLGEEAAGGRLAGPIARAVMKAVIG